MHARPGQRFPAATANIVHGQIEAVPRGFGLDDAKVAAERTDDGVVFDVRSPAFPDLVARLWRWLALHRQRRQTAHALVRSLQAENRRLDTARSAAIDALLSRERAGLPAAPITVEFRIDVPERGERVFGNSVSLTRDQRDTATGVVGTARDITERIDLMLLDLTMPQLDGRETYGDLRGLTRRAPIVFTTGYLRDGMSPQARDDPHVGDLKKPFRLEALHAVITDMLAPGTAG